MQQLIHTPTENPSTNINGNQQNIYYMNIKHQELNKGTVIENTLKCKPNSQQKTNKSWLVKTVKAILKTTIKKLDKLIFSFNRTNKASVRNIKILAALNGD